MFRWSWERLGKARRRGNPPTPVTPGADLHLSADEPRVTWVGHSTFLIQVGNLNFLTDPIWSERASPFQFIGPRRISDPGIRLNNLPRIDAILLSHDHYDHLDRRTVEQLSRKYPAARWFAPLHLGQWLRRRGVRDILEHDWEEISEWKGARITCIPAQHFSGRSVTGRNETLWCGWIVNATGHSVMFAGDTGLHPEFERISRAHGPVSVAILPIGAYDPRWFMRPVHMDPDDAVSAYATIQAANAGHRCVFIPSHWGTFVLTDEPADEPPERLLIAWQAAGFPPENCVVLQPGESFSYRS